MYTILMTIHIIACIGMIMFVLLQTGRGAGLSMFGGGGDSLINTPSGSSFMKKITAGMAATFAFTSLFLTLLSDRTGMSSVTSKALPAPAPVAAEAPAPAAEVTPMPLPEPAKTSKPAAPANPVKK